MAEVDLLALVGQIDAELLMVLRFLDEPGTDPRAWLDGTLEKVRNLQSALSGEGQASPVEHPDATLAMHLSRELNPECGCAVCAVFREYLTESFMEGQAASSPPHWQPIETIDTATEGRVLAVADGIRRIVTVSYKDGGRMFWCETSQAYITPTHWLALPASPPRITEEKE